MDIFTLSGTAPMIQVSIINDTDNVAYIHEPFQPPGNGQISFSSGIVAGPGMEVFPQIFESASGVVTFHG
jgi:hypothetical protein